jgi:hypothetical protein
MERLIACERHSTLTPFETEPLKPAPPYSLVCPLCLAQRNDDHSGEGTSTQEQLVNVGGSVEVRVREKGPTLHERSVNAALDRMYAKMRAEGRMPPDNEAEIIAETTAASREAATLDRLPKSERMRRRRSRSGRWGPDGEWISYA